MRDRWKRVCDHLSYLHVHDLPVSVFNLHERFDINLCVYTVLRQKIMAAQGAEGVEAGAS